MYRLKHHHRHYFSQSIDPEVKELYWSTILGNLALALVYIFEPIYLYNLGFSLQKILLFYILVYAGYLLFIAYGARFAGRFGYKHSILLSNVFYVLYWIVLFLVKFNPWLFWIAPFLFALQKSFFWPAYNADAALFSKGKQRGREVGVLMTLMQAGFIAGPFLGGIISEEFGFFALFITASVLLMASVYPLFRSPDIKTKHRFEWKNLWKVYLKYKSNFFGYWGYAEDMMVMSLWPIYIFIVVPDFFDVGLITTVAALIGTVLMLYIGKRTDSSGTVKIIRWSALWYGLTWIFRFLAQGLGSVMVFDTLTKTGKDINQVPLMSLTYENAGNDGPDEAIAYGVFSEISLSIGKIIICFAGIVMLSSGLSVHWVFALAGVMTMMYGMLK